MLQDFMQRRCIMSERLFLLELKMELRGLPEETIDEIIQEYTYYFQEATDEGLTDEEIIERLGGSATELAQSIKEKESTRTTEEEKPAENGPSILIAIGLILFNLIIVIGPLVALIVAGFALLIAFGVCFIAPLLVLGNFILQGGHIFELMISFVLFGGALLIYPGIKRGIHMSIQSLQTYIQWNKRVIYEGKL